MTKSIFHDTLVFFLFKLYKSVANFLVLPSPSSLDTSNWAHTHAAHSALLSGLHAHAHLHRRILCCHFMNKFSLFRQTRAESQIINRESLLKMLCFHAQKGYKFNLVLLDHRQFQFTYKSAQRCGQLLTDTCKLCNFTKTDMEYFGFRYYDSESRQVTIFLSHCLSPNQS